MGLLAYVKRWFEVKFLCKAKEEFKIEPITTQEMTGFVNKCLNIYQGKPPWLDAKDNIKTINFAKSICSETPDLLHLHFLSRLPAVQEQIGYNSRLMMHITRFENGLSMGVLQEPLF